MVSATRSARDTLSNKSPPTTPIPGSRKSERLEKKTSTPPPPLSAPAKLNSSKKNKNEKTAAVVATPLRRSERTNKSMSSPASSSTSSPSKCFNLKSSASSLKKKRKFVAEKVSDDEEERDFGSSSTVKNKRKKALVYSAGLSKAEADCHEESNKMDKSTPEGVNSGEETSDMLKAESGLNWTVKKLSEINETSEGPRRNQSDCRVEEASQMLESRIGPVNESSENNATLGSLAPSNATDNETSVASECDQSDCNTDEKPQMLLSRSSGLNENLIRSCVENDDGEKLRSLKRKETMIDMHSDVSTKLVNDENCNLIADAEPSRLCGNNVGSNGSCSKRIRRVSLSDVQSDQGKLINNVDQLSSKSEGVKLSTENEEERPQGNDVEHIRKQQRSLHLSLKPKMAKLCEILHLPDHVKKMVDNCLEYIMNNRQICTEPVTILQAFQLSLCWIAAALVKYKIDCEASVKLAKRRLNFNCKKDVVNEIYTRMWELREEILSHARNPVVIDSPNASESSNRVYSFTEVAPEVELTNKEISKSTKEIQKCENQLEKVIQVQQGETEKLKVDIEKEKADSLTRSKIELAAIQCCSLSDAMRRERLKFLNNEYEELKKTHERNFRDLKAMQGVTMPKFEESRERGELSPPDASKELETGIEDMKTCDRVQPQNGPKNVACVSDHVDEGKSFDDIVEAMTRAGTGAGLSKSPDSISPVVVLCSSPVELQTPLGMHAGAKEMGSVVSEDEPASRNKSHSVDENEYRSQGNIIPKHSNSREKCSGGAANTADEGEGCEHFSRESHNDCGQDTAVVLLSSFRERSDQGTSDVPNGVVALPMSTTSNSNDDQEVPSCSQGKLDRTILRKPVCGLSVEVKESFRDGVKNKASSNSQSSVELIPNCEDAAQIHEVDISNDSNNGETPKLPPSSERPCGGANNNLLVLDKELSRPCGTASQNDCPDANVTNILNQGPLEKQNPDGVSSSLPAEQLAVEVQEIGHEGGSVSASDRESPARMPSKVSCRDHWENVTPLAPSSLDQISHEDSVLDGNLSSRSCGASSSSNDLADALLTPPSLQQPDRVSLSIPTDQIPVIVQETSHEVAECQQTDTVMLDRNTTSDQQAVVQRSMPENTSTQEALVLRPADQTEPAEQVQPLSPVQSLSDPDTAKGTQKTLVSGPIDGVTANPSNNVSLVVELPVQVQQLTSEAVFSSNQDLPSLPSAAGIEHQPTNEDPHSRNVADASIEVPNQTVEQPASNLEFDSRSHQVVHIASNLDHESPMPVRVRTQSSDTRNLSTASDISCQPIQTATQSASRIAPPLSRDPLKNEMQRICTLADQNLKNHEDKKSQFKSDYEKEFEELRRKYEVKLKKTEVEFQQNRKELDTQFKMVLVNKALADAFRYKCLDHKGSSASGMHQDPSFAQQLFQFISQQISSGPPSVAGLSSSGPPVANLQSSYTSSSPPVVSPPPRPYTASSSQTMVRPPPQPYTPGSSQAMVPPPPRPYTSSSQTMVPPPPRPYTTSSTQTAVPPPSRPHTTGNSQPVVPLPPRPTYNTFSIFSSVSGLPHTNSIPSSSVNFQAVGDIRSPAPHLQPYRPPISMHAPTNSPAPHLQPRRPSMSMPTSTNLSPVLPGVPSRPASSNLPVNPPPFSRQHPSPLSRPIQSNPHKGSQPASAGGLPTPNSTTMDVSVEGDSQPGINPPNILSRLSDLEKVNLPSGGTSSSRPAANSPRQATSSDVVCLSDDE